MVEPGSSPRAEHSFRAQVDPDALKVLYRLRQGDHVAYLVGGSVRDLLLGRRPKDFDIGTSAHPYQVKQAVPELLDHRPPFPARPRQVRHKMIEVATFRRQVQPARHESGSRRGGRRQRDAGATTAIPLDEASEPRSH